MIRALIATTIYCVSSNACATTNPAFFLVYDSFSRTANLAGSAEPSNHFHWTISAFDSRGYRYYESEQLPGEIRDIVLPESGLREGDFIVADLTIDAPHTGLIRTPSLTVHN